MSVYKLCKTFRALPYPGGVMNQPKAAVERLLAIMEANDKIQEEQMEPSK